MDRRLAFLTALLAFTGVALGAFGAHGLKNAFEGLADGAQRIGWWETGVRYQLFHTVAVGLTGVISWHVTNRFTAWAAGFFTAGVVVFSGSLYVMCLTGMRGLGAVTPVGGVFFLAGWVAFAVSARGLGRTKEMTARPGEP